MMLIISILLGGLGIDRFMLGDTGIGVLKLLTGGCFGILTIIDWFNIQSKTKQKNYETLQSVLNIADSQNEKFSINYPNSQFQNNTVEDIKKLKELLDRGIITQEEFDKKKREFIGD